MAIRVNRRRILIATALVVAVVSVWWTFTPARDSRFCGTWQFVRSGDSISLDADGAGSMTAGGNKHPISWWLKDGRLCVEMLETQLQWRLRTLWGQLTGNPRETMSWSIVEIRPEFLLLRGGSGEDIELLRAPVLLSDTTQNESP